MFSVFKTTIGRERMLRPSKYGHDEDAREVVVLAVSGGPSSMAMLQLLEPLLHAKSDRSRRRFEPVVVHIAVNESDDAFCVIQNFAVSLGYSRMCNVPLQERPKAILRDATDRQWLSQHLVLEALGREVQALQSTTVFLGTNATRIASRILTRMVSGRGNEVPHEVSYQSTLGREAEFVTQNIDYCNS